MVKVTCGKCRHWIMDMNPNRAPNVPPGYCHRNPPTLLPFQAQPGVLQVQSVWPATPPHESCGEAEPDEDARTCLNQTGAHADVVEEAG